MEAKLLLENLKLQRRGQRISVVRAGKYKLKGLARCRVVVEQKQQTNSIS